jgi:hypothetical protein
VILIVILVVKLYEAFAMKTIIFTNETKVDQEPIMTNISTFQNSSERSPFMIAFYLWNRGCPNVTYNISAYLYGIHESFDAVNWY